MLRISYNVPCIFIIDDFLGRHRPRLNLPSVSDQILESAGMKTRDSFFDDALAEIKSKRRPHNADVDDLTNDPFFSKVIILLDFEILA